MFCLFEHVDSLFFVRVRPYVRCLFLDDAFKGEAEKQMDTVRSEFKIYSSSVYIITKFSSII